jgi:uncharacterized protein YbaP (TraB family)
MNLQRLALALAAATVLTSAQAQSSCPPAMQMPSAEQMQAGQKAARDRGFLWRISKDGRSSYLYGTIHIGKVEWAFPGKTVAKALLDADTLALEVDLTDPAVATSVAAGLAAAKRPELPAALRERLERQFSVACVPSAALASYHPVMQAITLSVLAARWDGLDPSYAQELSLAGFARAIQRPIVSLETVQSQMAIFVPTDEQAAFSMVDRTLDQLERNRVRPMFKRMGSAWENGDLAELESYERWCDCVSTDDERAFMQRLNDGRNPHLADGIDALHRQGKKVFAAVGALHMTGPKALPLLMAERGYTVERVAFGR